ncbi:hypothetical protein GCM10027276_41880 [Comamonas piscis]
MNSSMICMSHPRPALQTWGATACVALALALPTAPLLAAQPSGGTTQPAANGALGDLLRAAQSASLQAEAEQRGQGGDGGDFARDTEGQAAPLTSPGFRTLPTVSVNTQPASDVSSIGGVQPLVIKHLPASLSLYVGQMTLIELRDVVRVAVGNGKIMEARVVDQKSLLLTALDAGESTIHVWRKDGQVSSLKARVNVVDLDRIEGEISMLTAGITGVSISRVGEKIILDGSNLDPAAVTRLREIARMYGPAVVSFATSERLRVDRMIEMDVRIVEFSRSALDDLGMKWDTTGGGFNFGLFSDIASNGGYRILPENSPFSNMDSGYGQGFLDQRRRKARYYFGLSTALSSAINLQVQRGNAMLLASPKLTTRSGGEARFLSGGEIPLPAMSALGTGSVNYKPYGLRLHVKPMADGAGNISGSILAEVSNIDQSVSVDGIPGLLTRRTESEFNVDDGDTIILSGLISRQSSRATDGLPGLRNVPVLGWAFKNNNDSDTQIETVVFITPRVVTARDSRPRLERTQQMEEQISNGFTDLTEDLHRNSKRVDPPMPERGLDPDSYSHN